MHHVRNTSSELVQVIAEMVTLLYLGRLEPVGGQPKGAWIVASIPRPLASGIFQLGWMQEGEALG